MTAAGWTARMRPTARSPRPSVSALGLRDEALLAEVAGDHRGDLGIILDDEDHR